MSLLAPSEWFFLLYVVQMDGIEFCGASNANPPWVHSQKSSISHHEDGAAWYEPQYERRMLVRRIGEKTF